MLTKVFSTRLEQSTIDRIKAISLQYKLSIPKTLQIIVKKTDTTINDPWKNFVGQLSLGDDFEELIQTKRLKNATIRKSKKSQLND